MGAPLQRVGFHAMSESGNRGARFGVIQGGRVVLDCPLGVPDGARVMVLPDPYEPCDGPPQHVIVAGYGLCGRFVCEAVRRRRDSYSIIEANPHTVERLRALGEPAVLGDAGEPEILEAAGIHRSALLVLTMPEFSAVLRAAQSARALAPNVHIIGRTYHISQGHQACFVGANEVVNGELVLAQAFHDRVTEWLGTVAAHSAS